jgi:3D-(3,5/4)-trihydroxycyclohexane-1,2-dione acylhydrolase (decyclizing)
VIGFLRRLINSRVERERFMSTRSLTMAQALVRFLMAQKVEIDGVLEPLIPGVWAIFGHGNVAGLGEALYHVKDELPTYRAHNEQGMAHAAIAFAKSRNRQQLMACTTSIGPGATNMVTAAALAHVNRLPVLLLPGDTFASRVPDPVLQQIENFSDPSITANDCFKPVSRYWDRINHPEQLLTSLPRAIEVLVDPVNCGPVTLALPQDVQVQAYDFPEYFFAERVHKRHKVAVDTVALNEAATLLRTAKKPLIIAGGGVHYGGACETLAQFAECHGIPVAETQAGKSALPWDHAFNVGAIGVTGTSVANSLAEQADVVLVVGSRLQDFTTGSRTLFANNQCRLIGLNVTAFDAEKQDSLALVADAVLGLRGLSQILNDWHAPANWMVEASKARVVWNAVVDKATAASGLSLPTDAQVVGAVNRAADADSVVVCAAGGLPGELHKLWRASRPNSYHVEYGFSCMGYEIAGGLGVKMALPEREVFVVVGDGSYLMMNSELATAVMMNQKIILVVLDNRGFGCINRLQLACGGAPFNNLLEDSFHAGVVLPSIDFAAHAAALGAESEKVASIAELEQALNRAKSATACYAIVIDTDPMSTTEEGGCWWDVAVSEVSEREEVRIKHSEYLNHKKNQRK